MTLDLFRALRQRPTGQIATKAWRLWREGGAADDASTAPHVRPLLEAAAAAEPRIERVARSSVEIVGIVRKRS